MDLPQTVLLVVAVLGFSGQVVGVYLAALLASRNARRAQEDATKAQAATVRAQVDASKAQTSAIQAARELVLAAKQNDVRLGEIQANTDKTHVYINGQRSSMLKFIAALAARIARDNPDDGIAAEMAANAAHEAEEAAAVVRELAARIEPDLTDTT